MPCCPTWPGWRRPVEQSRILAGELPPEQKRARARQEREEVALAVAVTANGKVVVGGPALELAPFHRLELAAGKFRRPFGPCRGGYEAEDRADEARDHSVPGGLCKRAIGPDAGK
jgi:hypothetical protein